MAEIRELDTGNIEEIKIFFRSVFTKEPWNDDWSDAEQLHRYILDLAGNPNSLSFGLFENGNMVGLSMGSVKHWFTGTEYCIDEFCIKTEEQGHGLGTQFLKGIETRIMQKGMKSVFLQTNRNVPAYKFYLKNDYYEMKDHVSFAKDLK